MNHDEDDLPKLAARPEELTLPALEARPLLARAILAALLMICTALAGLAFAIQVLLRLTNPDTTPPRAVVCDQVTDGQLLYRLDPARSEARYQADERLLKTNTFGSPIGRTSAVDGYLVIDRENPAASRVCQMVVNISQLKSDSDERDRTLRLRFLESNRYPHVVFTPQEILDFPDDPRAGEPIAFRLRGDLTLKGITAPITWNVSLTFSEEEIVGTADTVMLMSTYGIGPIHIAGFVETSDDVSLTLDFVAVRVHPSDIFTPTPP